MKVITPENAKQALEIMVSQHVSSVTVNFLGTAKNVRFYSAVPSKPGKPLYQLSLQEDADGERYGKCDCAAGAAGMTCKHLLRAAEDDSRRRGIELYVPTILAYKAATRAEKKSNVVIADFAPKPPSRMLANLLEAEREAA